METQAPLVCRRFARSWNKTNYLRDKVLFWLYPREQPKKALLFIKRLQQCLAWATAKQEAILGQECRSLVFEAAGNLAKAIEHRPKEIGLIRRIQDILRERRFAQTN